MTKIIRLKSDNYNCYVSLDAYKRIILQMSSEDYSSHRKRVLSVSQATIDKICSGFDIYYVDYNGSELGPGPRWYIYNSDGTLNIIKD